MLYLNVEEIIAIHFATIKNYGGSYEILDLEKLKSCAETPQQTMFGEDLYPDLLSKAAIFFLLLIKNHAFMDGNKRTAILAVSEFLKRNGEFLTASNDELYDFAINSATSKLDKDQIAEWIRAHLREK